jgi:hypothetical protein
MGFEPKIPVFERAKTVHALDRTATVTGGNIINTTKLFDHDACNIDSKELKPPKVMYHPVA